MLAAGPSKKEKQGGGLYRNLWFFKSLIYKKVFCEFSNKNWHIYQIFVIFVSRLFSPKWFSAHFFNRFVTQSMENYFGKLKKNLFSKSSEQKKRRKKMSRNSAKQFEINLRQCVASVKNQSVDWLSKIFIFLILYFFNLKKKIFCGFSHNNWHICQFLVDFLLQSCLVHTFSNDL